MMQFLHFIEKIDQELLLLINGAHTPWLDSLFWTATQTWAWIPFYLLVIFLLWLCYQKNAWKVVLLIIAVVVLSDQISSGILKPLVHRLRPTHNPELFDRLRFFVKPDGHTYYGGLYGFPSSHAANHCVIATTLFMFLKPFYQRQTGLIFCMLGYVLLISYTRPYLGVHYPLDVLVGWLLGLALAWPISWVILSYEKRLGPLEKGR